MIIEFIGIPGSGKTHISHYLNSYLKNSSKCNAVVFGYQDVFERVRKNGKLGLLIKTIPFFLNPYFILFLLKILTRKSSFLLRKSMIKRFLVRLIVYKKIKKLKKKNNHSVFILDEGFLHFSIAFFRQNNEIPYSLEIKKFLATLDKIINYKTQEKIFVFVDSNTERNFKRLEERQQGWPGQIDKWSKNQKEEYLKQTADIYDAIKNNRRFADNSIYIDNSSYIRNYSTYFNLIIEKVRSEN